MAVSRQNADRQMWSNGLDEVENLLEETTALAKKMGKINEEIKEPLRITPATL